MTICRGKCDNFPCEVSVIKTGFDSLISTIIPFNCYENEILNVSSSIHIQIILTMNKLYIILSLSILVVGCGGSDKGKADKDTIAFSNQNATKELQEATDSAPTQTTTGNAAAASTPKGAQLIASFDCLTCHKEREKLIGPAYIDVAKKYSNTPENVSKLADKVIKGGSGNWGEVPMTPHPAVSVSDAREMVKYILDLK